MMIDYYIKTARIYYKNRCDPVPTIYYDLSGPCKVTYDLPSLRTYVSVSVGNEHAMSPGDSRRHVLFYLHLDHVLTSSGQP